VQTHQPSLSRVGAKSNSDSFRKKVLAAVAAIPEGRVTTYGAIARELKRTPRHIARVLSSLSAEEAQRLPWHRVVAAHGVISSLKVGAVGRRQIARLQGEGIEVSFRHRVIDFSTVCWDGPFRQKSRE
jgi:methylated-DNA-protein-cysteine methyltransferase-like protein